MSVDAGQIGKLLIEKYNRDFICIPECKIGSSWSNGKHRIIDLWCMAKSWAHPRTIAFEIKVSRNDFLRDIKWQDYLAYCTEFYFVSPPDIIAPDELPPEAGLMITSKNCKMMVTKKKAPMRQVQIPDSIYRYILMWRTKIIDESNQSQDSAEYWKNWLENRKEDHDLGYRVSRKVSKIVRTRIEVAEKENIRLKNEVEKLKDIKQFLDEIKFSVRSWNSYDHQRKSLNDIIRRLDMDIPSGLVECINSSINNLKTAHSILTGERS